MPTASVPKALIDGAIARGQGRSTTGAKLEPVLLEILLPPDVAIVVEAETDNRNRTLGDLRVVVKKAGALVGSTTFYFTKRGRAVFTASATEGDTPVVPADLSEQIIDEAIELEGVEDAEDMPEDEDGGSGGAVVWTEPAKLTAVTEALSRKLNLDVLESDIVWAPNEDTRVDVDSAETVEILETMLAGIKEYPEVKGIFANVRKGSSLTDDDWDRINRHLDV